MIAKLRRRLAAVLAAGMIVSAVTIPAAASEGSSNAVDSLVQRANGLYAAMEQQDKDAFLAAQAEARELAASATPTADELAIVEPIWHKVAVKKDAAPGGVEVDAITQAQLLKLAAYSAVIYSPTDGAIGGLPEDLKTTLRQLAALGGEGALFAPLTKEDLAAFALSVEAKLMDEIPTSYVDLAFTLTDQEAFAAIVKNAVKNALDDSELTGSVEKVEALIAAYDIEMSEVADVVYNLMDALYMDNGSTIGAGLAYARTKTVSFLNSPAISGDGQTSVYEYVQLANIRDIPVRMFDWTSSNNQVSAALSVTAGITKLELKSLSGRAETTTITATFREVDTGPLQVLSGRKLFEQSVTVGRNEQGGGGGGVTPPPAEDAAPVTPEQAAEEVASKLADIIANRPDGGQGGSDNAVKREAVSAAENVVREAGKVKLTDNVNVEGNVAKVELDAAKLSDSFKQLKGVADAANAQLTEAGINAPVKVVATLDLGTTTVDTASISIPADIVEAAREAGVDAIAIAVDGVTLTVDVAELGEGTTLELSKQPAPADASNETGNKYVSGVYDIEFLDRNGNPVVRFDRPVQVSLPVNNVSGVDTEKLTLAKLDNGKITYYGGKYNADTGALDGRRNSFSSYTVIERNVSFEDLSRVQAWAGRAIEVGAAKGIINGRAEGVYDPHALVTRAEFASLLVKTFGLEDESLAENFDDVSDNAWYRSAVAAAAKHGIVSGRSASQFDPNATITRAEMATMAANALRSQLQYGQVSDVEAALAGFNDAADVKAVYQPSVALMASEGLIKGKGEGKFDPNGTATRAEAAVIIYNLLNL